jgi:hypothetical protein
MTEREMLDKIIEIGTNMRAAQKGFFSTKDPTQKKDFLVKSKVHEKEFDNALFNVKQLLK